MRTSRALKIAIAVILLAALYHAADWTQVITTLRGLEAAWLAAALLLFIPQTVLSAWRWQRLAEPVCLISLREAVRQTLAASAINLVAPSKLGDLSKAAMLPLGDGSHKAKACGLVVLEKGADIAALIVLLLLGCWGARFTTPLCVAAGLLFTVAFIATSRISARGQVLARILAIGLMSLLLWVLHLAQIGLFLRAAGVSVPWTVCFARIPVAIFAGLLPVSFCGLGTRDAALVWLFADMAPAATMAGVGVLTALRYLVPGLLGIACLHWRPVQAVDAESISPMHGGSPA